MEKELGVTWVSPPGRWAVYRWTNGRIAVSDFQLRLLPRSHQHLLAPCDEKLRHNDALWHSSGRFRLDEPLKRERSPAESIQIRGQRAMMRPHLPTHPFRVIRAP